MILLWLAQLTGIQMFSDRLFRGGFAAVTAATIVFLMMPRWIKYLNRLDASSDFTSNGKPATPIMGGLLIVVAVIIGGIACADLNGYSISILLILIGYSGAGATDDLLKIRYKRAVANGSMTKKDYQDKADGLSSRSRLLFYFVFSLAVALIAYKTVPGINRHLAIPFVKPEIWYPLLPNWAFILLMCFVTTATANGANFTDGIDTLLSVPIITTALFAAVVAYVSGNAIFAKYLLLPHLPGIDELMPIAAAIIGAVLAYLWFNCPPAEIYMGDAGSIGLGGAIGMMFVFIKAELFLPIVGFIFLAEAMSSFLQISWFKYTRKTRADGVGQRIFLRAPIHEHYKLAWSKNYGNSFEVCSRIMWRFHLVSVFALILGSLIFFKVR